MRDSEQVVDIQKHPLYPFAMMLNDSTIFYNVNPE